MRVPHSVEVGLLPIALTRYFADSRIDIESFAENQNTLTLRIEKEIGPETGIITFRHVSFMCLPQSMPGEAMRAKPVSAAGTEFWSRCLLESDWFDPDDNLFEIYSQDGPVYFVVAKSVDYAIRT
jgi:hypothetical protein